MEITAISKFSALILGLTIGLGLLGSGFFTTKAIYKVRNSSARAQHAAPLRLH